MSFILSHQLAQQLIFFIQLYGFVKQNHSVGPCELFCVTDHGEFPFSIFVGPRSFYWNSWIAERRVCEALLFFKASSEHWICCCYLFPLNIDCGSSDSAMRGQEINVVVAMTPGAYAEFPGNCYPPQHTHTHTHLPMDIGPTDWFFYKNNLWRPRYGQNAEANCIPTFSSITGHL